jgi:hypothetical protein
MGQRSTTSPDSPREAKMVDYDPPYKRRETLLTQPAQVPSAFHPFRIPHAISFSFCVAVMFLKCIIKAVTKELDGKQL